MKAQGPPRRKTALVLSGGGARGAYEVGVLSYVFDELTRHLGRVPHVDVLSGTSVGAINACFLAAHMSNARDGVRRLVALWRGIELREILGFGLRHALSLPRVLTGGAGAVGLFNVKPITDLVTREIPWRAIVRSLRRGDLQTLSVSTTEVSTGRTVIFMQSGPEGSLPSTAPPRTIIRADLIGPPHALASAAIPILFPPVRIGNDLYTDGSLRQNTPIAPALRLGATHVMAIGLSRQERGLATSPVLGGRAPGAAFLLGKVLNAFLLDHIDTDLELLRRVNGMLDDSEVAFGPGATERLSDAARRRGGASYRRVHALTIRPSEDIGRLAADHVRRGKVKGGSLSVARGLLAMLDVGVATDSDLASYLLFDGTFASRLIELGRADAEARRDQLLAFFESDVDPNDTHREPPEVDSATLPVADRGSTPPPVVG